VLTYPTQNNWRGTREEWLTAITAMRAMDEKRKAALDWDVFRELKMRVKLAANSEGTFRSRPYKDWPAALERLWERAAADDKPYVGQVLQAVMTIAPDFKSSTVQETKAVKTKKQPKKTYNTCAVRFVRGHNVAKVYTYKVPKKVKLHLGEEVVVPSLYDGFESNSIAVVVELHKEPQDNQGYDYKFITGRITKVAA
jgi:hypothetical protein